MPDHNDDIDQHLRSALDHLDVSHPPVTISRARRHINAARDLLAAYRLLDLDRADHDTGHESGTGTAVAAPDPPLDDNGN